MQNKLSEQHYYWLNKAIRDVSDPKRKAKLRTFLDSAQVSFLCECGCNGSAQFTDNINTLRNAELRNIYRYEDFIVRIWGTKFQFTEIEFENRNKKRICSRCTVCGC